MKKMEIIYSVSPRTFGDQQRLIYGKVEIDKPPKASHDWVDGAVAFESNGVLIHNRNGESIRVDAPSVEALANALKMAHEVMHGNVVNGYRWHEGVTMTKAPAPPEHTVVINKIPIEGEDRKLDLVDVVYIQRQFPSWPDRIIGIKLHFKNGAELIVGDLSKDRLVNRIDEHPFNPTEMKEETE